MTIGIPANVTLFPLVDPGLKKTDNVLEPRHHAVRKPKQTQGHDQAERK